jgi:choline-glycine betaine transporter
MADEYDNFPGFEVKDSAKKLPVGWLILFWGLILWGIYYTAAYTPGFSGWSQEKAYTESLKP